MSRNLNNYSITINETNIILKNTYNVKTSILENYINAIISRINYIFNDEWVNCF